MLNALSPRDYDIVQSVFKELAKAEWFDRNPVNEKACARLVLRQFGEGGLSVQQLRDQCEPIAKDRFSWRH